MKLIARAWMRIEFTDSSIDGLRSVFSENKIFNGHLKITQMCLLYRTEWWNENEI